MATDPIASLLDADGRPRWDLLQREPICSRCGYNLTLLERPRCPECGFEFAWREIVEAASRNKNEDWLFEYAWRRRPVRSLIVTCWRALWPWSFWRRLSIHDPVRPVVLVALLIIVGTASITAVTAAMSAYWITSGITDLRWILFLARWAVAFELRALAIMAAWLFVVWSLRSTLSQCRVRFLPLFRITTYLAIPFLVGVPAVNFLESQVPFGGSTLMVVLARLAILDVVTTAALAASAAVPLGRSHLGLRNSRLIAVLSSFVAVLAGRVGWMLYRIGY